MLDSLLGSASAARVLAFIAAHGEGFATEIARSNNTDLSPIQKQLERLQRGGILVNKRVGRTRVYSFDTAYPLLPELKALLRRAGALESTAAGQRVARPARGNPMWSALSSK